MIGTSGNLGRGANFHLLWKAGNAADMAIDRCAAHAAQCLGELWDAQEFVRHVLHPE